MHISAGGGGAGNMKSGLSGKMTGGRWRACTSLVLSISSDRH